MKKKFLLTAALFLTFASVKISYLIAETFFFDKFFYQKSITHGYWQPHLSYEDFGKRAEDIKELTQFIAETKQNPRSTKILGTKDDGVISIAVIGDSLVWGQGLKIDERYHQILQKKLNEILPTKIYSLGVSGDSMVDNYIKYKYIQELDDIDLFIFGVVDNDLLFTKPNKYDQDLANQLESYCSDLPTYYQPKNYDEIEYLLQMTESHNQKKHNNVCVLDNIISKIDNRNVIFLFYNDFFEDVFYSNFKKSVEKYNQPSLSIKEVLPQYNINNDYSKFFVSEKDAHPSKEANQMFSDALYNYILNKTDLYQN